MSDSEKGFSVVELLIGVVVGGLLVGTTYSVTNRMDTKGSTGSKVDSSASKPKFKTGMILYEKLNYSYPSSWTVKENNVKAELEGDPSPGTSTVILTAPTGLRVVMSVGGKSSGFAGQEQPAGKITILGHSYDLAYATAYGEKAQPNSPNVTALEISDMGQPFVSSKNVTNGSDAANMIFNVNLPSGKYGVDKLKSDKAYNEAVAILESLHY